MSKKPCTHEYLANNESGKVLICRECGVVHLHLHNMSLRLDEQQFASFAALMNQAARNAANNAVAKRPTLSLVH